MGLRNYEIVNRVCEAYAGEFSLEMKMDFTPDKEMREYLILEGEEGVAGFVEVIGSKITRIENGPDDARFVPFLEENLPDRLIPSEDKIRR